MTGAIFLQIVLIFLNAVFASAEIAVISMNENKLKSMAENGNSRALKLSSLTEQPARFLATIQVAITLAGLLGSAFAAENFAGELAAFLTKTGVPGSKEVLTTVSVFVITLILAYFNLVFGELVPKRIAMKKSESLALGMSGMLYTVSKIFAPLVFLLTVSTNFILRLIGVNPDENEEQVSEEEIRLLLEAGNEQGTIGSDQSEMIQNIFEFDDISAEGICTHRIDVDALYMADSLEAWETVINSTRHTHYPIYGENADDIVGVLDTRDYFRIQGGTKKDVMACAMDQPYFIPETMKANMLFRNMKHLRIYFAVIIDEYGGMSGIITLHDLVETLVGDLYEMEDQPVPGEIEKLDGGCFTIYGYAGLDRVAEALKIPLPTDRYDTFSGFLCGTLGRIPDDGEQLACETHGLHIDIHSVENHRIGKTTVRYLC